MSTKNHFEHTLPPLSLANGTQLSAGLYSVEGGTRYRMVFGDHPERLSSPRVTFNSEAGRIAHFAGMLFRGAPRDSMAGMSMIDYFTKVAQGELGLAIGETSTMRKPIIVRCLAKYGFLASRLESTSVRAGLLPRGIDDGHHPNVHFISGNQSEFEDLRWQRFYRVIDKRELPYRYPLEYPSTEIDLHTSFTLE